MAERFAGCLTPPQLPLGLGPPCTEESARIKNSPLISGAVSGRTVPAATQSGGGQIERSHPGEGAAPFNASVLFFACFLASAFTSQRSFHALFLAWLQVKGVALNLLDNVFLLHLAFEATESVLQRLALLQSNFRQTETPPNSSLWDGISYYKDLTVSQVDDDEIPCILALKRFKRFKSGTRDSF